ncbi:uncharacterized protein LOC116294120 [Actinia tenebrosa]|uniref:Uncharacterized protein LOC116294120 n=1 Tax=Actinia tenebrosa TaxID=6105 RepID=A0A6P8HR00_ACTTE|nr:uncharacterized protein LOC116294120 [Actinia tenebrosa]
MAGWGSEVFTASNNWSWVPVIGSLLGGVLGAVVYLILIEVHHEKNTESEDVELERVVVNNVVDTAASNPAYERGSHIELRDPSALDPKSDRKTKSVYQRIVPNDTSTQNQNSVTTPTTSKKAFDNDNAVVDDANIPNNDSTQL